MASAKREIGPTGTTARAVGGLTAVAPPIALGGSGWWDAAAALVALPLVANAAAVLVTAAYRRAAPAALARRQAICSRPAWWLITTVIGAAVAVDVLTPASGELTLWVWPGGSMLVAAARAYAGCEVLAILKPDHGASGPDRLHPPLYTPIDRAEPRRAAGRRGARSAQR